MSTSLADLRKKLELLKSKKTESSPGSDTNTCTHDQNTGHTQEKTNPLQDRTNTTIDLTDNNAWISKIEENGNHPEDWLELIQHIVKTFTFSNRVVKHNYLSDIYEKALKAINQAVNKKNAAYARLFLDFAALKCSVCPEEAIQLLSQARALVRCFAEVHVMAAHLEYKEGNVGKASKILEKAVLFGAEPSEIILEALRNLKDSKENLFNMKTVDEISLCTQPTPSSNLTSHVSPPNSTMSTSTYPLTREVSASAFCPRIKNGGDARPLRVKKMNLAFQEINTGDNKENLDETISKDIKPLDHYTTFTIAHSSGYCSMMDVSLSMETIDKNTSPVAGSNSDLEKNISPNSVTMDSPDSKKSSSSKDMNAPFSMEVDNIPPIVQNLNVTFSLSNDRVVNSASRSDSIQKSDLELKAKPQSLNFETDQKSEVRNTKTDRPEFHKPVCGKIAKSESVGVLSCKKNQPVLPKMTSDSHLPMPFNQMEKQPACIGVVDRNTLLETPCNKGIPSHIPCTPNMMKELLVNGKHYWVQKKMGSGGSSEVFKVIDTSSDFENKAIKVVNLSGANAQIQEGYRNEIRLLERLQYCPKVIRMYDYEFVGNKLYIVMECGTIDFAHFIKAKFKENGHLSPHGMKYYWEDMLQGVGALHDEGIIHSDLKPANFLLVDGGLKLIDFGIAKTIQQDKTSVFVETQVGTLNYMSPETIMGNCGDGTDDEDDEGDKNKQVYKIGVKSDVWSLGCILYYMVYGHTPFQKIAKQMAKFHAIIDPNYQIVFKEIPDKNLLDVMKKCLIRDPKKRPSIKDLLQHPYVTGDEKGPRQGSVSDNLNMERLVMQLADKFASSPSGIRSLVSKAMKKGDL